MMIILVDAHRRDSFLLSCPQELGRLEKIAIGHDNSGIGASWFLEEVEVKVLEGRRREGKEEEVVRFPCGRWLEVCDGCGGQLEVDLFPVGVAENGSTQDVGM